MAMVAAAIGWMGEARAEPLSRHVDPRIGVAHENCIIGPVWPHGSLHPSPQTTPAAPAGNDGYAPTDEIVGFAQFHAQGTGGVPSYGQLLISPQIELDIEESAHASPGSDEVARIDYYAVTLDRYGIRCEVAPSRHGALYRFTYPPDVDPLIVLDAARKIGGPSLTAGSLHVDPASGEIVGEGTYAGNWRGGQVDLHYYLKVSQDPTSWGTFTDGKVSPRNPTLIRVEDTATSSFGTYLRFGAQAPRELLVKIGVSLHSVDRARQWIDQEIPHWNLETLAEATAAAWDEALDVIHIEGVSDIDRRVFYTALARTMTQPRDRRGDWGHGEPDEPAWDDHYTFWDTYRSLWPLMTIIRPDLVRSNLRSLVAFHRRMGQVGTAIIGGVSFAAAHQGGTEVDNVIVDAFVKGVSFEDWSGAYEIVRDHAIHERPSTYLDHGYLAEDVPSVSPSASATLALSLNDFGAARMAHALGRRGEYLSLIARSRSWRNLWDGDAAADGFTGFIRPRNSDGRFVGAPGSPTGFYEGDPWSYSFFVPHDVHHLISRMGGADAFGRRIRHGFDSGYLPHHNEPPFLVPWLPVYAGRPDLAADLVRTILDHYTDTRYPGQEDGGAMSSRYVFAVAGFFPNAGQPIYLLHGPRFPRLEFRLDGDRTFVVEGRGVSDANRYVQSAVLNGEPLDRAWMTHEEIVSGGHLVFEMGPEPTSWGRSSIPPCPYPALPGEGLEELADPLAIQVIPNPTRDASFIIVPVTTDRARVTLTIYDMLGRRVRRLLDRELPRGHHSVVWRGDDEAGRSVAPGIYVYEVRQGPHAASDRLIRLSP